MRHLDRDNSIRLGYLVVFAAAVAWIASLGERIPWRTNARYIIMTPLEDGSLVFALPLIVIGLMKPGKRWGAACGFLGVLGWAFVGVMQTGA